MNMRELILICMCDVILACLIFCGVGMIFHGCDGENGSIDAARGLRPYSRRSGGGRMQGPRGRGVFRSRAQVPDPDAGMRRRTRFPQRSQLQGLGLTEYPPAVKNFT